MSRRKKTDVSVAARIDTSSTPRRFIVEHAVSVKKDSSKYGSLLEAYNHDDHQLKVSVSPLPPKQDHFAELDKAVRKTRKIWRRKKKKELLQAEIEAELLQANHVVVEEVKKGEEEKEVEITVSSIVRELIRKESSKNVSRRVSSQRFVMRIVYLVYVYSSILLLPYLVMSSSISLISVITITIALHNTIILIITPKSFNP